MNVSVVIPAYNEADRIKAVLKAVQASTVVDEIIVVDDGSQDGTADVAECLGVTVVRHPDNRGKSAAMLSGAGRASGDILCFLDADLVGLEVQDIDHIVSAVLQGQVAMSILYRTGESLWFQLVIPAEPLIGGERCMRKNDFMAIAHVSKSQGFEFETACNAYFLSRGQRIAIVRGGHVSNVMKWEKHGPLSVANDFAMFLAIIRRFGLGQIAQQCVRISYRFQWLRLTRGWKDGAIVL